ncbi:single hybrid motif-containing protein [Exidia glandulosa HHB12029]|uniref:Single hybrid motif-containing protein n=1 Tax=Exidia glandulosa HHB12029 TaxID=1314781 RepID=A0A165MF26_EXIGL|nr:single hybrid motif-containing protein [Exidia glandulosa HHB12029]
MSALSLDLVKMSAPARRALTRSARRLLHSSASQRTASKFAMPAMSPTMTEGGIASWKKKEGDSFAAGDVLLEIETDKATIDVEAQDDGVLAKIIVPDGAKGVQVGQLIAVFAEEGDDLASLEIPKDDEPASATASKPSPGQSTPSEPAPQKQQEALSSKSKHHEPIESSKPLFPSVLRLLQEHGLSGKDAESIKGTGVRGMLTKGDVLAHLKLASSPTGTYKEPPSDMRKPAGAPAKQPAPQKVLDGAAMRQLIVESVAKAGKAPVSAAVSPLDASFASIIADYLHAPVAQCPPTASLPTPLPPTPKKAPSSSSYLDGLI